MKKLITFVLIAVFCITAPGCTLLGLEKHTNTAPDEASLGAEKVFTCDGLSITLTDLFREKNSQMGFDGYYVSEFCGVMVKIEPFSLKEGFENETLTEYIENVIENNGQDAVPEEKDGLVYYRYYNGGNAGWNFAYKGSDAFYLVQFICREDHETKLSDAIFSFAGSVTVR